MPSCATTGLGSLAWALLQYARILSAAKKRKPRARNRSESRSHEAGRADRFRLRFPRDLTDAAATAALAAFSGVPHGTRLAFDLSATRGGITHRLAISPAAADVVTGSLRAAIPSLRLDEIVAPERLPTRRVLWQLAPTTAAIRTDELAAISAGLLSALFPLHEHEAIRLTWQARPLCARACSLTPDRRSRHQALKTKLALPGLHAHGELRVSAARPPEPPSSHSESLPSCAACPRHTAAW